MSSSDRVRKMSVAELHSALNAFVAGCDNPRTAAAVQLLQQHQGWLHRGDFRAQCISVQRTAGGTMALILWEEVRKFLDSSPAAASSEVAVLEFAYSITRWSGLGPAHQAMLLRAATTALTPHAVQLDHFGRQTAAHARSAVANHGGHPNGAWSTGEQLAVALVLRDREHLDALGYTPHQAAERIAGELMIGLTQLNWWLDAVRDAAGLETWTFSSATPR